MRLLLRILVTAFAIWLTTVLFSDHVEVISPEGTGPYLLSLVVIAVIYGLVHAIIKPLVNLLALPLYLLTLGLISLLINALMLWITTLVTGLFDSYGLEVTGGFWWYVIAALVIVLAQLVVMAILPDPSRRRN
ncbi:phage holin family protein [Myceligenerans indicum]|uniref:Phage holin family protein n=1 Tax=Myceligenerans indicum TaxID=2593663 RepID=A0ABS1LJQ8_9MICO|nr:phage holin family protein [Myceligenerans indicum]MBL0886068.1 phage holin family protein [Myceligenerans indicum]